MTSMFLGFGCIGLAPLAIAVALVIFVVFWLREKIQRDELVLSLLAEIQEILVDIREKMDLSASRSQKW